MSDPNKIAAVKAALRETVVKANINYLGISIAPHVTDAEYEMLAEAAVKAADDFDNAPGI
jgi:hypothetical protein